MDVHGFGGSIGIPAPDGLEDVGVDLSHGVDLARPDPVGQAFLDRSPKRHANGLNEKDEHRVSARPGDGHMEGRIEIAEHCWLAQRPCHGFDEAAKVGDLVFLCSAGRQARSFDLEPAAHLEQLLDRDLAEPFREREILRERHRCHPAHDRTHAIDDLDESTGLERLQGFTDDSPADPELRGELGLGRQRLPRPDLSSLHIGKELVDHELRQGLFLQTTSLSAHVAHYSSASSYRTA